MRQRTATILAVIAACVLAGPAHAITYFVRTSGSDFNTGKTKLKAFRTIAKAMSVAKNNDTVWIGAGTYNEPLNPQFSGLAAKRRLRIFGDYTGRRTGDAGTITITRSGAAVADISKNYVFIRDITFSGGTDAVRWSGTGGTLQNVVIKSGTDDGLEMTAGSLTCKNVTIQSRSDCGVVLSGAATLVFNTGSISGCTGQGVLLSSASANATISRSKIFSQTGRGVDMTSGTAVVRNCVIYDNTAGSIRADGSSTSSLTVQYCTLVGGARSIELRGVTSTVQDTIMANSGAGLYKIGTSPATSLTHNNNLYWGLTTNASGWTLGGTDVTGNPAFTDPTNKDFSISGGSAAYNTGVNIAGVGVDYLNRTRPALSGYDIGAYEGQIPAPTVPYFTDFESTVGGEWSSSTTTASTTLSKFLGRFGNEAQSFRVATTVGQQYTLMFDAYIIDSWEGEDTTRGPDSLVVQIGSSIAMDETFSSTPETAGYEFSFPGWPAQWSQSLSVGGASRDQAVRSITLRFTATGSETVISFEGQGLEALSNESWGIDNVRVVLTSGEGPYVPRFAEVGHADDWYAFPGGGSSPVLMTDMSGCGLQDAVLGGASAVVTYENNDADTWTAGAVAAAMRQACVMDWDNNGVSEVWYNRGGSSFGAFRWTSTGWAGLTTPSTITGVLGCETMAAADVNKDGYCDLVLLGTSGNAVALNNGPDQGGAYTGFTTSTSILPQSASDAGDGDNCSVGDVNNDGYPDIFYHYNGGRLFVSNSSGAYSSNNMGISVTTGGSAKMGSAFGDYNNDGYLDLFVGSRAGTRPFLWKNNAGASFTDVAGVNGLQGLPAVVAAAWGDYDNDGDLDLAYVTTSGQTGLAKNSGAPAYTFTAVTDGFLTESRGGDVVFGDYDNDGDLDILMSSEDTAHPVLLFENRSSNSANSLQVRVVGAGRNGLNRAGIGARVELWDASNTSLLQRRDIGLAQGFGGQSSLRAHFGGVSPASTYTLRVYGGASPMVVSVTPATASTTFNNGVDPVRPVAGLVTITETETSLQVRVTRWREAKCDEDPSTP